MAPEFRYSLTRICLRTGQMSLSQRMAEIFPDSGIVRGLDTLDHREFELRVGEPRKVSGLAEYFERHRLEVNDQIQIRLVEDETIALTAMPRAKQRRQFDETAVGELLDSLVGDKPRTEAELRALNPQIPESYPLAEALEAHPFFTQKGGRWVGQSGPAKVEATDAAVVRPESPGAASEADSAGTAREGSLAGTDLDFLEQESAEADPESPEGGSRRWSDHWSERWSEWPDATDSWEAAPENEGGSGQLGPVDDRAPGGHQPATADRTTDEYVARANRAEVSRNENEKSEEGARGLSATGAKPRADRENRRPRERSGTRRPAAVTPYPRGVLFPGEASLNSQRPAGDLKFVNRAREALAGFGYRVEGLPHGMLLARADLGRRKHSVLVRVLADGERLDWAALLARRREQTADYLAVVGDHRDLHRLTAPADLARATLWSWDGIARVQNLAQTILVGPFDLEPHFAKDGMFGNGLQQFERSVGRMIAEKGVLSAVIARLGALRAPAVFVLDDLVEEDLQREQVAKSLELLAQAPFHLVARIDRGEYCLRHSVEESLAHLSEYALSLGERLPGGRGRRARIGVGRSLDEREQSIEAKDLELAEEA